MKELYDIHEDFSKYLLTSTTRVSGEVSQTTQRKNQEFLQKNPNIAGQLQALDKGICNKPYRFGPVISQFKIFNPEDAFESDDYYTILKFCIIAHSFENNGDPFEHASKLYTLFKTPKKCLNVLKTYAEQDVSPTIKQYSKPYVHEACLFTLPEVRPSHWELFRNFAIKSDLSDREIMQLLAQSHMIENAYQKLLVTKEDFGKYQIDEHQLSDDFESFKAEQLKKIKKLKKSLILDGVDRNKKTKITIELAVKYKQYAIICKFYGQPFEALDRFALIGIKNLISEQSYLLSMGLSAKSIDTYNRLDKSRAGKNIPDIGIVPIENYPNLYMRKLNIQDNQDAMKAACLGKLTDCCQSIGDAGESCVIHGLTDPNGGFYVICKGDAKNPSDNEDILIQSWVWTSDGTQFVIDSIEFSYEKMKQYKKSIKSTLNLDKYKNFSIDICREIYSELTFKLHLLEPQITKIHLGLGGNTPINIGLQSNYLIKLASKIEYTDSEEQGYLYDENYPSVFLLRLISSNNNEELKAIVEKIKTKLKNFDDGQVYFIFRLFDVLENNKISLIDFNDKIKKFGLGFDENETLLLEKLYEDAKVNSYFRMYRINNSNIGNILSPSHAGETLLGVSYLEDDVVKFVLNHTTDAELVHKLIKKINSKKVIEIMHGSVRTEALLIALEYKPDLHKYFASFSSEELLRFWLGELPESYSSHFEDLFAQADEIHLRTFISIYDQDFCKCLFLKKCDVLCIYANIRRFDEDKKKFNEVFCKKLVVFLNLCTSQELSALHNIKSMSGYLAMPICFDIISAKISYQEKSQLESEFQDLEDVSVEKKQYTPAIDNAIELQNIKKTKNEESLNSNPNLSHNPINRI